MTTRLNLERSNSFFIWIVFMIWPFLSLILSIKNFRTSWSKNILWAFITFFGFTFAVSINNRDSDVNRYIERFKIMRGDDMSFKEFWNLLYIHEDFADVLQPVLTLIVSKFTGNPFILIAVFGFVFGYFYSRNIYYIIEKFKIKNNSRIFFLLLVFTMIVPFWTINGFRFWTATHIFFYGAIRYIFERKKYGLVISSLSFLCHFSFFLPPVILLLYIATGNRLKLYFYLFIISMFVSEFSIDIVKNTITNYLPDIYVDRTEGYLDDDRVENYRYKKDDNRAFYAIFYMDVLKWSIITFIIFIYYTGQNMFRSDSRFKWLFTFTVLLYCVSNLMNLIPSGGRFITVSNLFALAVIIRYINSNLHNTMLTKLYKVSVPFFVFYLIVNVWVGFTFIGLFSIIGNPITSSFGTNSISLADIIK